MRLLTGALGLLALGCGGRSGDAPIALGGGSGGSGAGGVASAEAGAGDGALEAWPGAAQVSELGTGELILGNVSGLTYEASTSALWAVANIPGSLHRLVPSGAGFVPDAAGWSEGKLLRFPNGSGLADAESVTLGGAEDGALYVASEHDNAAASLRSRLSRSARPNERGSWSADRCA